MFPLSNRYKNGDGNALFHPVTATFPLIGFTGLNSNLHKHADMFMSCRFSWWMNQCPQCPVTKISRISNYR